VADPVTDPVVDPPLVDPRADVPLVDPRRDVPRTDAVLADPRIRQLVDRLGPGLVKQTVRRVQHQVREGRLAPADVVQACLDQAPASAGSLRPVLNATGVLLHTNLGRAPLSQAATAALGRAAGYVDVEFDADTGTRSRRGSAALAALLARVAAAEQAMLVNNGAAALVLAATALAAGREIVVSRGELVEIGDGFRLPDLLASTGATLREVGTTNRTHLADYRDAIGPATGFVLKVHPSNFTLSGFTSSVSVAELATLGVPVVADIGSGLLEPEPLLPAEPDATSWLRAGADLVTASGDKLLGGPQAGVLLGRAALMERLRRHPLARALRVDKLTLAAFEASISGPPTPTAIALHADPAVLRARAEAIAGEHPVVPSAGVVGGGSAPGVSLAGWAVALPERFAAELRRGTPCVVARVVDGACLVDLRCVPPSEDRAVRAALLAAAARLG
jgi:L-seryl-tRNA(Ser) seleniumtransferase